MTNDPGTEAFLDQVRAEYAEAGRLVPIGQNRRLASCEGVRGMVQHAIASADFDGTEGSVPLARCHPAFPTSEAAAYTRAGNAPVITRAVGYCYRCSEATAKTVGFWVNCGRVVVQIDLCVTCAKHAIDHLDAVPQIGIPDTLEVAS